MGEIAHEISLINSAEVRMGTRVCRKLRMGPCDCQAGWKASRACERSTKEFEITRTADQSTQGPVWYEKTDVRPAACVKLDRL